MKALRWVLVGDAESPHLLKWARALVAQPGLELWVASSRGFLPGFDACVPHAQRLALHTRPRHAGGNAGLLASLPRLGSWLRAVDADVLHAHYLTSHGTLALLAKRLWRLRGELLGSAWGSDILETPQRHAGYRLLTRWVLQACRLCTSDAQVMSQRMRELGAREVLTFPFGLEAMPEPPAAKQPGLFFANRGLEPIYQPLKVLDTFAALAAHWPEATLVVANDGSLREAAQAHAEQLGLAPRVRFVGRLNPQAQAEFYQRASFFLSLPRSDSVSVSVLEAMAHGALPLLSELPANREVLGLGPASGQGVEGPGQRGGLVLPAGEGPGADWMPASAQQALCKAVSQLAAQQAHWAQINRAWVAQHAMFFPHVQALVLRLQRTMAAP